MRVAIVHDWLTNLGGAERVVLALHELFPTAPIYTSVYNQAALPQFKDLDVRTSFLQHWPWARSHHQWFPTLRAQAFESFDFSEYDLVISSASAEAKGIITKPGTMHLCYCHTPTRYYWSDYQFYYQHPGFGLLNPLVRAVMPGRVSRMRQWDFTAAQRVDVFIANSQAVSARIQKYYRRDSSVIYPPAATERFQAGAGKRDGFLVVGRQVAYKRIDLAVQACSELKLPLTVIGNGSEHSKLRKLAGPNVNFITTADDSAVAEHYRQAKALLFPGEEDFGIVGVEALASGTPVIAYGRGGMAEIVADGKTGLLFKNQTVADVKTALTHFKSIRFVPADLAATAEKFDQENFKHAIRRLVEEKMAAFK